MSGPEIDGAFQPFRVALLGMYSSANLGDVAIQMAVMRALAERRRQVTFTGICTDPADASRTFGMPARNVSGFRGLHRPGQAPADEDDWAERAPWPVSRAMAWSRIRRHMRGLDMLLVSGSGQIDDFWGGPWEQPMRLLAWSHAARGLGRPVAYFGVGVDQLQTPWGRRMALAALRLADLRVLRDHGSLAMLGDMGLAAPCEVCPDPAFYLTAPAGMEAGADKTFFAVISPIARNAWPQDGGPPHDHYLDTLAACADALQLDGVEVRFACSQTRMDPPLIAQIQARMRANAGATVVLTPRTVEDFQRSVQGAQVVLASRLHALILAMTVGTPVIAISPARKVRQQMSDAGLAPFDVPYAAASGETLIPLLKDVRARHAQLRAGITEYARASRESLGRHFDALARLIPLGEPAT